MGKIESVAEGAKALQALVVAVVIGGIVYLIYRLYRDFSEQKSVVESVKDALTWDYSPIANIGKESIEDAAQRIWGHSVEEQVDLQIAYSDAKGFKVAVPFAIYTDTPCITEKRTGYCNGAWWINGEKVSSATYLNYLDGNITTLPPSATDPKNPGLGGR